MTISSPSSINPLQHLSGHHLNSLTSSKKGQDLLKKSVEPPQSRSMPNGDWDFLGSSDEQVLSSLSIFTRMATPHLWARYAQTLTDRFIHPHLSFTFTTKTFEALTPAVSALASLVTQIVIRNFNYDSKLEKNPQSQGEIFNRAIKSTTQALYTQQIGLTIFSTTISAAQGANHYLGLQSLFLTLPVGALVGIPTFIGSACLALLAHSILNRLGVIPAYSKAINYITNSNPQPTGTKDEDLATLEVLKGALQIYQLISLTKAHRLVF